MESIKHSLSKLMSRGDFQLRYENLKQELLADPLIEDFINENSQQISSKMIEQSLGKLYEYQGQSKNCGVCTSLETCQNLLQGYSPRLFIRGNRIDVQYDRCDKKMRKDYEKKHQSLIKSYYIPKDILNASMGDLALDDKGRFDAIKAAQWFIENYNKDKTEKGLYLHGSFGVGKTFIFGAIANELADKGVASMLIYTPEFMREMKSSIQDHTLNQKIEMIKKVPILMFDDFGAESMSSWMRDDILGVVLQYRMMEQLPTFFSSNMNLRELEHHLSYTQRGEVEKLKAARIIERIKQLSKPIEVSGQNRRNY